MLAAAAVFKWACACILTAATCRRDSGTSGHDPGNGSDAFLGVLTGTLMTSRFRFIPLAVSIVVNWYIIPSAL